jgi:hypothetical protein
MGATDAVCKDYSLSVRADVELSITLNLGRAFDIVTLAAWNDHPDRTVEDVWQLIDDTILRLQAQS